MALKRHHHARPAHADILRVIALLPRAAAAVNEWQRRQISEGFTINQALVMHHLVSHGDASPSDLADWMQVTRGSVTPVVQRLEILGLLARRADQRDGRRQWLTATQKARDIAESVEKEALRPALSAFADWSSADLKRFASALERMLAANVFGGRP